MKTKELRLFLKGIKNKILMIDYCLNGDKLSEFIELRDIISNFYDESIKAFQKDNSVSDKYFDKTVCQVDESDIEDMRRLLMSQRLLLCMTQTTVEQDIINNEKETNRIITLASFVIAILSLILAIVSVS